MTAHTMHSANSPNEYGIVSNVDEISSVDFTLRKLGIMMIDNGVHFTVNTLKNILSIVTFYHMQLWVNKRLAKKNSFYKNHLSCKILCVPEFK